MGLILQCWWLSDAIQMFRCHIASSLDTSPGVGRCGHAQKLVDSCLGRFVRLALLRCADSGLPITTDTHSSLCSKSNCCGVLSVLVSLCALKRRISQRLVCSLAMHHIMFEVEATMPPLCMRHRSPRTRSVATRVTTRTSVLLCRLTR